MPVQIIQSYNLFIPLICCRPARDYPSAAAGYPAYAVHNYASLMACATHNCAGLCDA